MSLCGLYRISTAKPAGCKYRLVVRFDVLFPQCGQFVGITIFIPLLPQLLQRHTHRKFCISGWAFASAGICQFSVTPLLLYTLPSKTVSVPGA
jgi:hypothetical protein